MSDTKPDTKISWLKAAQVIQAEIGNRRYDLQQLKEKMIALEGEISGLSEAHNRLAILEEAVRKKESAS
jgi:hypothetical protein